MFKDNSEIKGLNAKVVKDILEKVKKRVPVLHLSQNDRTIDGDDIYILRRGRGNNLIFEPNITQQGILFMGTPEKLEGIKYYEDQKLNNIKIRQFKKLIESFPLYDLMRQGIEIDGYTYYCSNPYTLAALYGLDTPYLPFTSSIDMALYYATHIKNENGEYVPKTNGTGYIYIYSIIGPLNQISSIDVLGLQIFPYSYNTKSFMYLPSKNFKMDNDKDIFSFTFCQDGKSHELYEDEKPQSNDFLFEKLKNNAKILSKKAIEEFSSKNAQKEMDNLQEKGYKIVDELVFELKDLNGLDLEELWLNMLNQVVGKGLHSKILLEKLKCVPLQSDYKRFFNIKKYYEEK